MLSFKDIKIIENTLETKTYQESDKAFNKVYQSLVELVTSRLVWELKQNLQEFCPYIKNDNVKVSFKDSVLTYQTSQPYMKLKNDDLSLFWGQREMAYFSDYLWRGKLTTRSDNHLYQSDIFLAKNFAKHLCDSIKKAVKPLITLDDYRVNELYRQAIYKLQSEKKSFSIEISMEHFVFKLAGECLLNDFFIVSQIDYSHFDVLLVSN